MPRIDIMSMIGSAVPAPLRSSGHLACWYVMVDGQQHLGPYVSPDLARDSKRHVERQLHWH
ncbi:hypothetical protein IB232_15435 [Pseudomonas sp. PDM15]|uniref:hypothetical protein n=1 Tax=Pseudomonas sp. PDM15 TaxID=2769303 RepID=UPI001782AC8C|nr:hypothetical protein [Pseudomonas sp. PDM15]MBD9426728.1 hypothetical protein [Pseudomonas sp. PDM15]